VQLVLKGKPICKYSTPKVTVGVDLGPSTVAIVSECGADLSLITPMKDKSSRTLQRKIARSKRLTETVTQRAKRLYRELAEIKRKEAATRHRWIGNKANQVLSYGHIIKIEKLSYKAFQKCFGKSVGRHAPGMFVEKLSRKAENAGGELIEINTYQTKLSQRCHGCERCEKKPLSERFHRCPCGIEMQRDLYSAFLAIHVKEDRLDTSQAEKAWPCAQSLMRQAVSRCVETARDKHERVRFGFSQRQSCSSAKGA
jgi:transposase